RVFTNGTIQTRGVANAAPDPWRITRSDIKGEVVFTVWELGWLLKALPLLAVGVFFWVAARPWIGERIRRSWDRGWMTVLAALPLWVLRPLVSATVIATNVGPPNHRRWANRHHCEHGHPPGVFPRRRRPGHPRELDRPWACGGFARRERLLDPARGCVPALVGLDRRRFGRRLAARRLHLACVA